jgi:hypothetical protein
MVKQQHWLQTIRVVFGKAEFEIEQRSFGNRYKTHVCSNRKAIGLCYFKPETMFSPSWGLDRALAAQAKCKIRNSIKNCGL